MPDRPGEGSPEHDAQLRKGKRQSVALIDQHDIDIGTESLGQPGRQLETAQPSTSRGTHADRL
jgi:hypothetical protein